MALPFGPPATLEEMEARVDKNFANVRHMRVDELSRKIADGEPLVLADIREAAEFDVSRLSGAVRIDPSASAAAAVRALGAKVAGKTVVLYCSVGQRSSVMARRAGSALRAAGARDVVNLRGGIFRWRNEELPVVDDLGATMLVHPFGFGWGRLLERQDLAASAPRR